MVDQPVGLFDLVIEFRARPRIAVRQIERRDQNAVDGRLHIPALLVTRIAWERIADQNGLGISRENRYAIPGPLTSRAGVTTKIGDEYIGARNEILFSANNHRLIWFV